MKKPMLLPSAFALALASSTASAAVIAYDGFDGGTVFNGGTGWSGDWSAGGIYAGSNLSYGALTTTGTGANIDGYWNGESLRTFAAQTGGTLWMSWVQNSGGTDINNPNQMRIMNGGSRAFVIGQHFDGNTFKIYDGDFNQGADSGTSITGTHLITLSINFVTDIVDLYVDPTGLGSGAAPLSAVSASWNGFTGANIDGIRTTGGGNSFAWDEVRIGNTWADVSPIPEPGTSSVLVLGAVAMMAYRSRRKS